MENRALIKPKFTLHHGWGFSSNIWTGWIQHLEPEFEVKNLDRGYFGPAQDHNADKSLEYNQEKSFRRFNDKLKTKSMNIVVAHSLGLHVLSKELLAETDMLVCLGAFSNFVPADDRLARRTLHRMQTRFRETPRDVLAEFHYKSFDTPGLRLLSPALTRDEGNWNLDLLASDLALLETSKLDYSEFSRIPHVLVMHGMNDIIVPPSRAYELQRYLPQSRLILHNSANHALPFLHMDWCLQQIMCYVDEIETLQSPVPARRAMVGALDS